METKKHYLVYKTTNLVNGKIYIGKHETDNLDDGYLGSGTLIQRAIEKYGKENFKREILFECSSRGEMNAKEAELVNEEFLKRDDIYNLKQGGEGGWDYIVENRLNTNPKSNSIGAQAYVNRLRTDKNFRNQVIARWLSAVKKARMEHPEKFRTNGFQGKHHTEETKAKIRKKARLRIGDKNGSFGTVWIYNESLEQNKKVKKEQVEDFLNQGWKLGRKMGFHK